MAAYPRYPRAKRRGGNDAADPQTFKTEESATKFCKQGNVVWFNPASKIYFDPGSQFYGKTKAGGFTCREFADKAGFRANKGN